MNGYLVKKYQQKRQHTAIAYLLRACISVVFFSQPSIAAAPSAIDLFHIERNKNSNLVQYTIDIDTQSCQPKIAKPVRVFWRDLEVGPNEISKLLIYEQPAYGIKFQGTEGNVQHIRLKALPEKLITIEFAKTTTSCEATPYVSIQGNKSKLLKIYVFAKENFIGFPSVKWIEVRGEDNMGQPVKQKILKD